MVFFLGLAILALVSGFCSSYLGAGGGVIIVSLLPILTDFSASEIIQISLALMVFITLLNSLIFLYKKLVAWDWVGYLIVTGGICAFLAGSFVTGLSDFSIRFLLWSFLFLIVGFSLVKTEFFQKHIASFFQRKKLLSDRFFFNGMSEKLGLKVFGGALMGLCSGLTGLGGGVILSPLLHESHALPLKKISPSVSFVTLFMAVFAISGQQWRGLSLLENESLKFVFPVLLVFAILGLSLGHVFHGRGERRQRVFIVRTLVGILFLKVSVELLFFY